MNPEKYVVFLSGGNDSTAMLLRLLEENDPWISFYIVILGLNFLRYFRIKGEISTAQTGGDVNAGY